MIGDPHPFDGRLLRGEKILWSGRPGQGIILSPRDGLLIPFSIVWGGFAIFWESKVLNSNAPGVMALFGIPFVLVGLFLMVGRFPLDAWLRARTVYAVTDRRVLILRKGPWADFRSLGREGNVDSALTETSNGRGTIRFGPTNAGTGRSLGAWIASMDPTPQFLAIEDARRVFDLVQQRPKSDV